MARKEFAGYSDTERKKALEKLAFRSKGNPLAIKYLEGGARVEFISGGIQLIRNRNNNEVLNRKKNIFDVTELVAIVLNVPYSAKRGADITRYYVNDNLHLMGLGAVRALNTIALNEINATLYCEGYIYPLNGRGVYLKEFDQIKVQGY